MNPTLALQRLQDNGYRLTTARKAVVEVLARTDAPISAAAVLKLLAKKRVAADRATVYRELEFLVEAEVAVPIRFEGRAILYELAGGPHHHHAVCLECEKVIDLEADSELEAAELRIAKRVGFKVLRHSFELFGVCKVCR